MWGSEGGSADRHEHFELGREQDDERFGDATDVQAVIEHADAGLSLFGRLRPALFVRQNVARRGQLSVPRGWGWHVADVTKR